MFARFATAWPAEADLPLPWKWVQKEAVPVSITASKPFRKFVLLLISFMRIIFRTLLLSCLAKTLPCQFLRHLLVHYWLMLHWTARILIIMTPMRKRLWMERVRQV